LRDTKGVSGIVYEQTCATEKRRRRKRGTFADPDKRVFINQEVCEGCGDCSVQSNCVSIQPLETEFGRKRAIDQSTCNKDFSCVKGFCPSFVTVTGATIAKRKGGDPEALDALIAQLPHPPVASLGDDGHNLLVAGIGGTGVLTVGALLGMAAHLEGKGCNVLDLTGMAQKGGAVTSHIRTDRSPESLFSSRLGVGMTDVILACDMIVSTGADVLKTVRPGQTAAIVNLDVTPTGEFQTNRKLDLGTTELEGTLRNGLAGGAFYGLRASSLSTDLTGDSIGTNVLMLGYAAQKGLLPVSIESIEEAIRLNGIFVKGNLRTFALGRVAAHAPEALERASGSERHRKPSTMSLEELLASRIRLLTDYQNEAYAELYRQFIREIDGIMLAKRLNGGAAFVYEVAQTLATLMAYKDEYEVARLYADPHFWERLRQQFDGDFKVTFHLAPPMLPGHDATGRPKKRAFGPWMLTVFKVLRHFKTLRNTPFDVFGYTSERRMERRLADEYRSMIRDLALRVDQPRLAAAIKLASAAYDIRGYGVVKDGSAAQCAELRKQLLCEFEAALEPQRHLAPAAA
jgi:indolepyruvate ferredoxin oxidoreductase